MDKTDYLKKIVFVKKLKEAILPVQPNVENIKYDVLVDNDANIVREYLVVEYVGGAITARNCRGNSCSAILKELSKYLDDGYYDEVDKYLTLCSKYKSLDF